MSAEADRSAPYRITTDRLVLRCWDPRDAPLLKDAIDSSLDHLRAWMPWAHDEPKPVEEKVELLRVFRGRFDLGEEFVYGILTRDESEVVGGCGLHPRIGSAGFEIGYWIRASRTRQGLAAEASAALTRAAFDVCGVDKIEIHVDQANVASCGVPRKLGYVEEGTLRRRLPPLGPGEPRRDELVFALLHDEYEASPLARFPLEAFDAAGAKVL